MLVLCFLDIWDIDEGIITFGLTSVKMDDFPKMLGASEEAQVLLRRVSRATTIK